MPICPVDKLDGVAPSIADPPDATPPLSKITLFEINHFKLPYILNQS